MSKGSLIPGYLSGETITLYSGQVLPVLVPNIRGMFAWNVNTLINVVLDAVKDKQKKLTPQQIKDKALPPPEEGVNKARDSLRNFLDRIYFDLRNLGQTPAERALNFTATNAFQAAVVFADSASQGMQLDCITTEAQSVLSERTPTAGTSSSGSSILRTTGERGS